MKLNFLFILIIFGSLLNLKAQPWLLDEVVGIVGDNPVLRSDIELQFLQVAQQAPDVPEADLKCDLFSKMMMQKMFLQQAKVDSIQVGEDEVEGELDRRIRYYIAMIGSKEKLESFYGKSIIEIKDEFRKDIHDQLLSDRMQSKVFEGIKVTPSEVKQFFNNIPKDSLPFFNAEVELAQLVIEPKVSPEQQQMAYDKIRELLERVQKGEDFGTLAMIYSQDPGSANESGDLGYVERGEMVMEFEAAAFSLKPGGYSDIVKTEYGYHIIKMEDRRGNKVRLRHILIRPQLTSFDMTYAQKLLDSIRTQIVDGKITFEEAVAKFSDDDQSKGIGGAMTNPETGTSFFEINQLDKALFFAIDGLKDGEISPVTPFQTYTGDQAYRILMVKSRTEPHVANLKDDYSKIQTAALSFKKQEKLEKWMKSKMQKTYIFVDESYSSCEAAQFWYEVSKSIKSKYD